MISRESVYNFIRVLQAREDARDDKTYTYDFTIGKKYARVTHSSYGSKSVYAFVDMENGNLLFPASYNKPSPKTPRGNILGDDPLKGCNRHSLVYLRG